MHNYLLNLFSLKFCQDKSADKRTERRFNIYEDKHIQIRTEYTKEIVNGRTKNETSNAYIYNKDNYYKPRDLLPLGNSRLALKN